SAGFGDIVGLLIRHGADVNASSADDSTALICAADNGHMNVLALLLNAGAQVNLLNRNGETALARATRRGWVNCARLLLTYGANPNPMPTDGHPIVVSPLHLARQMHQPAIEKDILNRAISMENQMLEIVHATLPKHVCLLEPGHIVDSRTSSFFPLQLISEEELQRFVLHFKTPPGFDRKDGDEVGRRDSRGLSDELILVYLVRAHLSDGQPRYWLTGPSFSKVSLSFNGTKRSCTRLPIASDYPGLSVFSVSTSIKTGGLNTLSLETPANKQHQLHSFTPVRQNFLLTLIGAYRVRIDVTSLVQASAGLGLGGSGKPTIYIPRSMS
ncbi:putative Multiple ankyrin repeats single kh domain protein, partial [Fasciolopsis buskii]